MDQQERLKRRDTTKGPPLRVLSLDGGGVRGYSMLILLQELMHKTYNAAEGRPPKPNQIPRPCDYFDLIVGSGTGGLIAIMLGRLRLDIETCKEVYIRMTRRVFETNKTFAGIPYRSTLFKASKLEEAIRDCVAEHTLSEAEGNDGTANGGVEMPVSPAISMGSNLQRRQSYASSTRSGLGISAPISPSAGFRYGPARWRGNSSASLYDNRRNRTKTAVTAVYKGTAPGDRSVFLRSYDSRAEPPPEFDCTIWQAGRATCAIGLAFKPIQIGQSIFHDEGAGAFNPTPQVIDECVVHEWPNRDIGVLVSIGTGKRPSGTGHRQSEWWEGFFGGTVGNFAEARRTFISKIEECEKTHRFVRDEYLSKRGINPDNYYRLNVEVGVGEFGMSEWSRLAEISTNTRMYLSQPSTRDVTQAAADKLGRIERMRRRISMPQYVGNQDSDGSEMQRYPGTTCVAELPGDEGLSLGSTQTMNTRRGLHYNVADLDDKFSVLAEEEVLLQEPFAKISETLKNHASRHSADPNSLGDNIYQSSAEGPYDHVSQAPPLPPKTPLDAFRQPSALENASRIPSRRLPYPVDDDDDEEEPPHVDMGMKPTLQG